MTGVTLDLMPHQVGQLAAFAQDLVRPSRRPDNLIRRGFVERVGRGTYRITDLGRAALERAQPVLALPDWRSEHAYGIYTCRAGELVLVACADTPAAVGAAIVAQGEDAHEAGVEPEALGVMDGQRRRWLAHPPWGAGTKGRI